MHHNDYFVAHRIVRLALIIQCNNLSNCSVKPQPVNIVYAALHFHSTSKYVPTCTHLFLKLALANGILTALYRGPC